MSGKCQGILFCLRNVRENACPCMRLRKFNGIFSKNFGGLSTFQGILNALRGWGGVQGQESPSTLEVTRRETLGNMPGKKGYVSGKSQGNAREKGLGILADTLIKPKSFGTIWLQNTQNKIYIQNLSLSAKIS